MKIGNSALLLALAPATVSAQVPKPSPEEPQSGLLYGPKYAYFLTAPKGWVIDNQAWASDGIHAVFYPEGSSPSGKRVAYTRFFGSHPKGSLGRADADLAQFLSSNPSAIITKHPDMQTRSGLKATIRSTSGDTLGNAEWLAYIEAPTGIIFIALVTKDPKEHPLLRAQFDELVGSCTWVTDSVQSE